MTHVRRGRGGWETETGAALRVAAAAVVCLALVITGCSSKKQAPAAGQNPTELGNAQKGMGESSLSQFQKGELGATTGGPLHDIHFGYNDYTVQPQDGPVLRSNAQWLTDHPKARVQIEGHCDERGSEEYNIALGARRAQSAKDYLVTLGIPSSRMSTISYGKELPLCTDHDETCWAQNRRDHFVVTE